MHPNKWAYVKQMLTNEQCDRIVELAQLFPSEKGKVNLTNDPTAGEITADRSCNLAFITIPAATELGLYDEFADIHTDIDGNFNNVMMHMSLDHVNITAREALQYTDYNNTGDHYDWHQDTFREPFPKFSDAYGEQLHEHAGLIRKMSMTIFLNDPQEWTGGDLEIEHTWSAPPDTGRQRIGVFGPESTAPRIRKGSAVIFQSDCFHRVTPVTSGNRKTLVGWYLGPPWV